ncbi:MAG: glycoside hydrolase family 172 protein [bacterium]
MSLAEQWRARRRGGRAEAGCRAVARRGVWLLAILVSAACRRADEPALPAAPPQRLEDAFTVPAPGMDSVTHVAALPLLRSGALTKQVSSRDPAGGNADGFAGGTELYVDERGEHVVFDDFGPGCIQRAWFTTIFSWRGRLRLYVDDLERPLVDEPFLAFFRGARAPFVSPLVSFATESSGGFVSYVPICYARRAKLTLSVPPEFFAITYRHQDLDHPVRSFTLDDDVSLLRAQWLRPERDPKPRAVIDERAGSVEVAPGESREIVSLRGAGAVWNLSLGIEPFEQHAASATWLVARWDGHATPDVQAPVPDFFGSSRIDRPAGGLLVGRHGERYVTRFPMPFWSSAEIRIENRGTRPVTVSHSVELLERAYPAASGYFTARYHHEAPTSAGRDYRFADVTGAGHFVGVSYAMQGSILGTYLEGDERFYVDRSATPALQGTGTEDYFNGGWYFLFGRFSQALFGAPYRLSPTGVTSGRTGAYRVHLGDLVTFFDGARFAIEHDATDDNTHDDHASVAYLYLHPEPLLVWSDAIDVGDPASEASHGYRATDASEASAEESTFEGDDDDRLVRDSGRLVSGASELDLALDARNEGVLLRRRLDQRHGRQQAEVLVDGQPAGTWYDVFENPIQRWAESDFLLPASLTRSKSRIHVELVNRGRTPWTELGYRAGSILAPAPR